MMSGFESLGDPQDTYPVIHITGTNGKGSVARMISELLRASGLSVGTYTSPHLEAINERITWNSEPITSGETSASETFPSSNSTHRGPVFGFWGSPSVSP